MRDGPLQFTLRRLHALVFSPRFWAVILTVTVILGVTGPFGTYDILPFLPRLGYWLAMALMTFFVGYTAIGLMSRYMIGDISVRPIRIALGGLAAGAPVTMVVLAMNRLLFGELNEDAADIALLLINCSLIAAAISFLFGLVDRSDPAEQKISADTAGLPVEDGAQQVATAAHPPAGRPPLLARLPTNARGRLAYMSMQDHYVDVHTDAGSALVLMRLADAIAETGDAAGLQIHRSHWVALDAVEGMQRKDGRLFLRMRDGALLPVSRSAMGAVRRAGLT